MIKVTAMSAYNVVAKEHFGETLLESVTTEEREKNLMVWNTTQFSLWLELVKTGKVQRNDGQAFGQFGLWFFNFVGKNQEWPSVEDLLADW